MTQKRTNVVPFERPAAYWAVKARKHYAPTQLPDAARLMRKALEKSGDAGLALELSEIYAGMGCYTAAERCLIRFSSRRGLTGSLCYAIGCCALNRGNEDLGERALDQSLRLDPDGPYAEHAQELLESYPWQWDARPHRCARGEMLCERSYRAKDAAEALALAEKAWKKGRCARTGWRLGMLLPPRQAVPKLSFACKRLPYTFEPQLLLAKALYAAGKAPQARAQMRAARRLCRGISDAEAYCEAAWGMHWPREALRLAEQRLEKMPGSVDYLRLKYLSLARIPGGQALARRTLETLLEADPDDAWGKYCRRRPEERSLDADRGALLSALGSLVYAVPDRLRRGKLNRILHLLIMTLNGYMDAEQVCQIALPLWRRLTPAQKRAWDEWDDRSVPTAMALYLLARAGNSLGARQLLGASPKKKRIVRLLHLLIRTNA
ncbi:MAG: hypothetical protein IKQ41_11105 [Clostridia bacterium]|nr:hypothetical protein [Clostridia bacterium]